MKYYDIDPVALDLGLIQIHWYGLMYLLAFLVAYLLARYRVNSQMYSYQWQLKQVEDLIFYGALGVILGGRLGYILFYQFSAFLADPIMIFKVWQGGMSFHGGLIGVIIAMLLFAKRANKGFFEITDFVAPLVPLGLGFGRIANYINGELWGKITTSSYGVYALDHNGQLVSRYPSQLYEAFLEGLVLFIILWLYSAKKRPRMAVSAVFLIGYGFFRFLVEFVRTPDAHIGYLAWDWLTMGQVLSVPMILLGIILLILAYQNKSINSIKLT